MKSRLTPGRLFWAALALVIISNTLLLLRVRANRNVEPESLMILTERELDLRSGSYYRREDSGLVLYLEWRNNEKYWYTNDNDCGEEWLDEHKLQALGLKKAVEGRIGKDVPKKQVFFALEYDGPHYAQAVACAVKTFEGKEKILKMGDKSLKAQEEFKSAKRELEHEKNSASRLFIVDVSLDQESLRKKYPDRSKVMVVRGRVKAYETKEKNRSVIKGYVEGLDIGRIHVPLEHRSVFESLKEGRGAVDYYVLPPRYSVTLAVGGRLEPYIVSVEPLK
jgi:hypothetical protein